MSEATSAKAIATGQPTLAPFLLKHASLLALLALIIFNVLFTNHFVSMQTLNVNLTQVATIVIVGVGMTLVIATGGIDLSVGSLMAISGAIAPLIFLGTAVKIGVGVGHGIWRAAIFLAGHKPVVFVVAATARVRDALRHAVGSGVRATARICIRL